MTGDRGLKVSPKWATSADDVAEITLSIGDNVMSRIADTEKHSVRDYFRASATTFGLWFADNWWRLRWETLSDARFAPIDWRLRHELNSAEGGALWPPLMIYSAGGRIAFAPSFAGTNIAGPQRYFPFDFGMVSANEYEAEIDRLFGSIIEHCARNEDAIALSAIVDQINTERSDPELSAWRRLEACLGYDPDDAPDAVVDALVELEPLVGEDGVEEAVSATPGEVAPVTLGLAIEAARNSSIVVSLDLADDVSKDWRDLPTGSPYKFAEAAAANLRRLIGAPRGAISRRDFADIFKAHWHDLKEGTGTARGLQYAARLGDKHGMARLALQTVSTHDRRFELSRMLGDAVWQSGADFGVVSRARTDRQKFQSAFAHNMLCPIDDLRRIINVDAPTHESIDVAARTLIVHPSVVRNQLVYNGHLPFEPGQEVETE